METKKIEIMGCGPRNGGGCGGTPIVTKFNTREESNEENSSQITQTQKKLEVVE